MSNENDIMTPVARLVGGHPMRANPVTDNNNQPKLNADGTQRTESYIGLAIPKGGETHWNQTEWGQRMYAIAQRDWPNGESGAASFAWKIIDGDSAVPNRNGIAPNSREGYPGHWIINASTSLPIKCFHAGRYAPHEQIQNDKEIKPGDYCRVLLNVKGNGPSQSPGIYVNPVLFELSRAGVEIVLSSGPAAADVFGGSAPVMPANAQIDNNVAAPAPMPAVAPAPGAPAPAAPAPMPTAAPAPGVPAAGVAPAPAPGVPAAGVAPAPDFLNPAPAKTYNVNGQQFTAQQLLDAGWQQAQIDALGQ